MTHLVRDARGANHADLPSLRLAKFDDDDVHAHGGTNLRNPTAFKMVNKTFENFHRILISYLLHDSLHRSHPYATNY